MLEAQGAASAAGHMAKWHAAFCPVHVTILNRKVTDWFVFAEELWVVRPAGGESRQYRTATVYPVNEAGKFEGALGFGRELEELSPSAGVKLGLSFWPVAKATVPANG
jgi:hypothetical protein